MELLKTIIQGKLLFSNANSFGKALKMYEHRIEAYYKNDIIFAPEDIFDEESLTIEIPRLVRQLYEKTFKNTSALIEYCSQFAVSGFIDAWLVQDGNILIYKHLEPVSDKVAVKEFIKGRELADQEGKEQEAIDALTKAIEKYDNHALAYERRAKVNFILEKYHDAKRDYGKSIQYDARNPYPFAGRADVHIAEENWQEAIDDLELAIKLSVALQSVYWRSRRVKAQCHMKLQQYEKAEFDLRLFTNRVFKEGDSNIDWIPYAQYHYGLVLIELEKYTEALDAFSKTAENIDKLQGVETATLLRHTAIAKKNAGKNGYIKDLKEAVKLGDPLAAGLLKEFT